MMVVSVDRKTKEETITFTDEPCEVDLESYAKSLVPDFLAWNAKKQMQDPA